MNHHRQEMFAMLTRNASHEPREPLTTAEVREAFDAVCELAYRLATLEAQPDDNRFADIVRQKIADLQYLQERVCCPHHGSAVALSLLCNAAPEVDDDPAAREHWVRFGRSLYGVGGHIS